MAMMFRCVIATATCRVSEWSMHVAQKVIVVVVICLVLLQTHHVSANNNNHHDAGVDTSYVVRMPGHDVEQRIKSMLPHTYVTNEELPTSFAWDNVNGTNYLTKSLNQHIPQWCGSCWAHAAMSSLADRIKIARNAAADDIHLSIQYILNCGADVAGSCNGGSPSGAYQFIHDSGFVPYDTCQPYIACSANSTLGFCPYVDTTCTPNNICRTCTMKLEPSLHPFGEICREIIHFPNATIAEYGVIRLEDDTNNHSIADVVAKVRAEIFARGPVTAGINGAALHDYHGGIYSNASAPTNMTHSVSIVGWDVDDSSTTGSMHWLIRNSWGVYYGEMGYIRILAGQNILGIEQSIAWATPGQYTTTNWPCNEDGTDCTSGSGGTTTEYYRDPSIHRQALYDRLRLYKT